MSPTSSSSSSSTSGALHHSISQGERYIPLGQIEEMDTHKKSASSTSTVGGYITTTESRTRLDAENGECIDGDKDRLQKLGYDAVLGRPLGFWSNMFLTLTNMSPVYDIVASVTVWSHNGPLLFIIGYPFIAALHLIMLGPFAELSSAFPVAGAHATWSWRCARAGIRGERYWGWLMNGFVLAAHLAKASRIDYVLGGLWHTVTACVSIFIEMTHVPVNPLSRQPLHREVWWEPVFHIVFVTAVSIVVLSRIARTSSFWIITGLCNVAMTIVLLGFVIAAARNARHNHQSLSFPDRSKWNYGYSLMIFLGLPLKFTAFDAGAHMAEETRNPARTVPRSLYTAAIIHFTLVYITVVTFIFALTPGTGPLVTTSGSLLVPLMIELKMSLEWLYTLAILIICISCTQLISGIVVCSRFLFAIARDQGIPFSRYLKKTWKGEPWVSTISMLVVSYLSLTAWFYSIAGNNNNYYLLLNAVSYWVPCIPYLIVMFLYATSKLNLHFEQRTQFTLRRWSKPMAVVGALWMLLNIVHGCFPTTVWTTFDAGKSSIGQLSFFPFAVIGMLIVMALSWVLYGRRHYVGPIRSMTKWSAGIEIGPDEADQGAAAGRKNVVKEYMSGDRHSNPASMAPPPSPSPLKFNFKRSSYHSDKNTLVSSERSKDSQATCSHLPAQAESQLLPGKRLSWYQRHESRSPPPNRLGGIAEASNSSQPEHELIPMQTRTKFSQAQQESGLFPHTQTQTQFSVAQQESGILPTDTQFSVAQQESAILPTQTQTQTQFSVAQLESGVFPSWPYDPEATHISMAQAESQILPDDNVLEYPHPLSHRPTGYPAPPPRSRS